MRETIGLLLLLWIIASQGGIALLLLLLLRESIASQRHLADCWRCVRCDTMLGELLRETRWLGARWNTSDVSLGSIKNAFHSLEEQLAAAADTTGRVYSLLLFDLSCICYVTHEMVAQSAQIFLRAMSTARLWRMAQV